MSVIAISENEATGGHTWELALGETVVCSFCGMALVSKISIEHKWPTSDLVIVSTGIKYRASMRCTKPVSMAEIKRFMESRGHVALSISLVEMVYQCKDRWGHKILGNFVFSEQDDRIIAYATNSKLEILTEGYWNHPKDGKWLVSGSPRHDKDTLVSIEKAYEGMMGTFSLIE